MKNTLWTKDFTILTLGTVVSMLGNAVSGFAIGLMVLDYSNSVFLYALCMVVYSLPRVVMPIIAGPYLDAFSRKKAIYILDFISAGLYLLIFVALSLDMFSYAALLILTFIIGSIDSIYQVAYDSFYPNIITEGNFGKAYSISSILYPLTAVMTPVAAYFYDNVGVEPLFAFNAVTFLIAAIFETQIKAQETHIATASHSSGLSAFTQNLKEGLNYIKGEKGLLIITVYFMLSTFAGAASGTVVLPYFKAAPGLGVMAYTYVMAAGVFGRMIGGFVHYRFRYPVKKKFAIALFVYITLTALEGGYLFFPTVVMGIMQFAIGFMGVTSYNIRISATQSYVPDSVRARFNGAFQMVCTVGSIAGQLIAGALADYFPHRALVAAAMGINFICVFAIMIPGRKQVAQIYNRQV